MSEQEQRNAAPLTGDALSKFLSFVLRHKPETIGIALDAGGWVEVTRLLAASDAAGKGFDRASFLDVVGSSDKQRFTLSSDGKLVRAAQGHSVSVDLGLAACEPPIPLYHGTAQRFLASIIATGLEVRSRRHVHLSADIETATAVGRRYGSPAILVVDTAGLSAKGQSFWRADNGVWLTDPIAPAHLRLLDTPG